MCDGVSNNNRQLLAFPEPDLSLAVSLLHDTRGDAASNRYFTLLTAESIELKDASEASPVAHRLRQNKPQFPLLSLCVPCEHYATPQLISALSASTTLTSFTGDRYTSSAIISALSLQLKSVPTLRAVNHTWFADDVALELLRSRTNWSRIYLPTKPETAAKASAFAALYRSDFKLRLEAPIKAADLNRWLANPHLTHLHLGEVGVPVACYETLYSCQNLTFLVWVRFILVSPLFIACNYALARTWAAMEGCHHWAPTAFPCAWCTSLC